jgi:prophage antirepressor-like protein
MNQITPFNYGDNLIRVVNDETTGEPLWVAKDVCAILDYKNVSGTLAKLDDDEKGIQILYTLGGDQEMMCVTESGLYTLILRSNKPEAKPFKRWVTHEVLPTIRKTGSYSLNQNVGIDLTPILSIMETQTRIMETMQMQSAIALSLIDSISKTQDDIMLGMRILTTFQRETLSAVDPFWKREVGSIYKNERMSNEQRNILYTTVTSRSSYLAESVAIKTDVIASAMFAALKTRFQRAHYGDISDYQFDEAIEFVNSFEIMR